jgi:pyrimidine-nucleoside phosphorylase
MGRMIPQWLIEKKRDGIELTSDEIRDFMEGFTRGRIPDYQMAAFAMAVYFKGMAPAETAALTRVMLESGDRLAPTGSALPRIDKHSTGGIGDKVSLILAPLVACCGVSVPMIAGRGLGLTGGTIDKLESIPGVRTDLTAEAFNAVLDACGCAIMGQTPRLCPADRKLYALRDVTGTVPSIPLITASILSKKLAESLDGLVLDVKCGSGAFMRTPADAEALARSLMAVGRAMHLPVSAWITAMDQPLGRAAGNRPEIAETVEALRGHGPADLMAVTLALAARMLRLAGLARTDAGAVPVLENHIRSGAAEARFLAMIRAQGGDPAFLDDPAAIEALAPCRGTAPSPAGGWVAAADADAIGRACLLLGAGRSRTGDAVDPDAGVYGLLKAGDPVRPGQPLARLTAGDSGRLAAALPVLASAYRFSATPVASPPVLLKDMGVPDHD